MMAVYATNLSAADGIWIINSTTFLVKTFYGDLLNYLSISRLNIVSNHVYATSSSYLFY